MIIGIYQSKAQSLVGVWQRDTNCVLGKHLDTYCFFSDGTFCFNSDENNSLSRILSIGGSYIIVKNQIVFHVKYTIERSDGILVRDTLATQCGSWSIKGGVIKKMMLRKTIVEKADLDRTVNSKSGKCLLIDMRKYFKISNNPDINYKSGTK